MEKIDIEHVVSVDSVKTDQPALSTVYTGDHVTNVHHKSPTERKLVLKAQVLIATLAALVYFVAYLVWVHPSAFGFVKALYPRRTLLMLCSGSKQYRQCTNHGLTEGSEVDG